MCIDYKLFELNTRPILTNTRQYKRTHREFFGMYSIIEYKLYVLHPYWTANLDQYMRIVLARIDLDVFVLCLGSYWFTLAASQARPPPRRFTSRRSRPSCRWFAITSFKAKNGCNFRVHFVSLFPPGLAGWHGRTLSKPQQISVWHRRL